MKIALISGSQRKSSQSTKVANFCKGILNDKVISDTSIFDLGETPLPIWEPGMWEKDSEIKSLWKSVSKDLVSADGFVIICPEYSGMASPALKNLFLYFSGGDLAHKPALIITVSSGLGGSYPNSELRASSYKNTRVVYIPDHVIVRYAEKVLNATTANSEDDERIRARIDYSLDILVEYVKALQYVRSSKVIDLKKFATGM